MGGDSAWSESALGSPLLRGPAPEAERVPPTLGDVLPGRRVHPYYTERQGCCRGPRARVVPLPQQGELRQRHLQPRLPGPRVAAEDVQHHGEPVEHPHAPGGLQLFLGKENARRGAHRGPGHSPETLRPASLTGRLTRPRRRVDSQHGPQYLGGRGHPLHVQEDRCESRQASNSL